MKCPHCTVEIFADKKYEQIYNFSDRKGDWRLVFFKCPSCMNFTFDLENGNRSKTAFDIKETIRVYPKGSSRPPCPQEVPQHVAEDYTEACLVLIDSPKASAALSRRCLQNILREAAEVNPSNLSTEIQEVLDGKTLPTYIAESIDAVRNIGNFATHPNKSNSTGEILPVEPEEAEWNLDVLEALFDFYYVQPAKIQKKKGALNKKLKEAGKKPMK
ncbi:MAG: DUF4145 domain-containing protein [Promethearchaeota archaeon]